MINHVLVIASVHSMLNVLVYKWAVWKKKGIPGFDIHYGPDIKP